MNVFWGKYDIETWGVRESQPGEDWEGRCKASR